MEKSYEKKIHELTKNQSCFDCGDKNCQWTSLNNAIFLCLTCAGEHRSLGKQYSFVRSVSLDKWNDEMLLYMKLGGNQKLKKLKELDSNFSWQSDNIITYRFLLESIVKKNIFKNFDFLEKKFSVEYNETFMFKCKTCPGCEIENFLSSWNNELNYFSEHKDLFIEANNEIKSSIENKFQTEEFIEVLEDDITQQSKLDDSLKNSSAQKGLTKLLSQINKNN